MHTLFDLHLPIFDPKDIDKAAEVIERGGRPAEQLARRIVDRTRTARSLAPDNPRRGVAVTAVKKSGEVRVAYFSPRAGNDAKGGTFLLFSERSPAERAPVAITSNGIRHRVHVVRRMSPAAHRYRQRTSTRWGWTDQRTEISQEFALVESIGRDPNAEIVIASGAAELQIKPSGGLTITSTSPMLHDSAWVTLLLGEQIGVSELGKKSKDTEITDTLGRRVLSGVSRFERRAEEYLAVVAKTLRDPLHEFNELFAEKFPNQYREISDTTS